MQLANKRIVIIGGTSGIGAATAKLAAENGASLIITGLSDASIDKLKSEIKTSVEVKYFKLDIADEKATKEFFAQIDEFDYLTTPGSTVPKGEFLTMESAIAKTGFNSKFWGQYYAAKYAAPKIKPGGAIVFFSGVISQRPQPKLVIMTAVNSAVEGLGRALAVELAPIRVNVISPGFVDTPRYHVMPENERNAMINALASRIPLGKIGSAEELAQAVLFLMTNTYVTGTILDADGGYRFI